MGLIELGTIIAIYLKLSGQITVSWGIVILPEAIMIVIYYALFLVAILQESKRRDEEEKRLFREMIDVMEESDE